MHAPAEGESLICFADDDYKNVVIFTRNASTGQVTKAAVGASNTDANFVVGLYAYLGVRGSDVEAGRIYMTDDNLRAAFGFDYQGESFITWATSPVAIILDPAIGIPKTGGRAGILAPALLLLSVAVAVSSIMCRSKRAQSPGRACRSPWGCRRGPRLGA